MILLLGELRPCLSLRHRDPAVLYHPCGSIAPGHHVTSLRVLTDSSVLGSRRFYYISQETLVNDTLSDEEMLAAVQDPGQCGTEQAGLTADDHGRVYIMASEHNAIFYVDTLQAEVTEEVNGVPPGGSGPVASENYWVKTLVRSGLIQHADSAAILDGWLYFNTNQLELSPSRQYMNVDRRKGPFRSYKTWIGRGPAV